MKPPSRVVEDVTSWPLTSSAILDVLIAIDVGAENVAKMLGCALLTVCPGGGATSPKAGGVVAALTAQGLAGSVPVSGQDGDHAAINRIALGTQPVSIWKDSRDLGKLAGEDAVALAQGKKMSDLPNVKPFSGGVKHVTVNGTLLTPLAVTKDNLDAIVAKGWITKDEVCSGVKPGTSKFCG